MTNKNIYIAGPCVIESQELLDTVAAELVRLNKKYGIDSVQEFLAFNDARPCNIDIFISHL